MSNMLGIVNQVGDFENSPFQRIKFLRTEENEAIFCGYWYDPNDEGFYVNTIRLRFYGDGMVAVSSSLIPENDEPFTRMEALVHMDAMEVS